MNNLLAPENTEVRAQMRHKADKRIKKLEHQQAKIIEQIVELTLLKHIIDEADGKATSPQPI